MDYCPDHSSMVGKLGNIEGKQDLIITSLDRLDKRINGTFNQIGDHIKESPIFREKIGAVEESVKGLHKEMKDIKQEKLNTIKSSQWRIGLIVGCSMTILTIMANIVFNTSQAKSMDLRLDKQYKVSSDNNRILKDIEK